MQTDDNTYATLYPDVTDQHSRGAGVDWHNQVAKHTETQKGRDRSRERLQRALSMAKRAVDRNDWAGYDEWIAEATSLRTTLGG